jgi:hypothetical protein
MKLTINCTFWPGLKVSGRFNPLKPNPTALWLIVKMVIVVDPVLIMKAGWLLLSPTATLLNHNVPGEQLNGPRLVYKNAAGLSLAANGLAKLGVAVSETAKMTKRRTSDLR